MVLGLVLFGDDNSLNPVNRRLKELDAAEGVEDRDEDGENDCRTNRCAEGGHHPNDKAPPHHEPGPIVSSVHCLDELIQLLVHIFGRRSFFCGRLGHVR